MNASLADTPQPPVEPQTIDQEQFGQAALDNIFKIWIVPEVERRQSEGTIGEEFFLYMAQIVFPQEGENEVRLNEEVRGVMQLRASRAVEKGENVLLDDFRGIEKFELEEEELDHGHITIVRGGKTNSWMLAFNARAGRKKSSNLARRAEEFLEAAKQSVEAGRSGPAIDNLFSACELLARAELTMMRSHAVKSKKHGAIGSAINGHGRLGNVPDEFVRVLNRVSNQRSAARYEGTTTQAEMPTIGDIAAVENYLAYVRDRSAANIGDVE